MCFFLIQKTSSLGLSDYKLVLMRPDDKCRIKFHFLQKCIRKFIEFRFSVWCHDINAFYNLQLKNVDSRWMHRKPGSTEFLYTFSNNNLCFCWIWQELFVEWYKFQNFCLLPCNVRIKSPNVYKFFWRCMQITCPYVNTTSIKIHVDINCVNKFSIFLPLLPLNIYIHTHTEITHHQKWWRKQRTPRIIHIYI